MSWQKLRLYSAQLESKHFDSGWDLSYMSYPLVLVLGHVLGMSVRTFTKSLALALIVMAVSLALALVTTSLALALFYGIVLV